MERGNKSRMHIILMEEGQGVKIVRSRKLQNSEFNAPMIYVPLKGQAQVFFSASNAFYWTG